MTGSDATQIVDQFLLSSSQSAEPPANVSKGKTIQYLVDNNGGQYGTGQVVFDAATLLNGSGNRFSSLRDAFITVPYVVSLKNSGAGALHASANITSQMLGLKCGLHQLVDKIGIELNNKSIVVPSSHLNLWNNIRVMTEWSASDMMKNGPSFYLHPDEVFSISKSGTAAATGDGFTNNANDPASGYTFSSAQLAPLQSHNTGFWKRTQQNPVAANALNWTTLSQQALKDSGRGMFVAGGIAANAVVGTWCYMLKIKLVDLHPIFKSLDLTQNPQLKLTIQFNTGAIDLAIPASANTMSIKTAASMQNSNTCPVMVASSAASSASASGGLNKLFTTAPAATTLTLQWAPVRTTDAPATDAYFPYTSCRLHVPSYDLVNPLPIVERPLKTCRYLDYYVQSFKNYAASSSFALQVSSSLKNIKYVAVIPFANTAGTSVFATAPGMDQFASPFDSAPWTSCPGSSVEQFNVSIANQTVFSQAQNYDYDQFLNEISRLGAVNGAMTHETSCGILSEQAWSYGNRFMLADCSRLSNPDIPASVLITGVNGSPIAMDYYVVIAHEKAIEQNRITGEVEKLF